MVWPMISKIPPLYHFVWVFYNKVWKKKPFPFFPRKFSWTSLSPFYLKYALVLPPSTTDAACISMFLVCVHVRTTHRQLLTSFSQVLLVREPKLWSSERGSIARTDLINWRRDVKLDVMEEERQKDGTNWYSCSFFFIIISLLKLVSGDNDLINQDSPRKGRAAEFFNSVHTNYKQSPDLPNSECLVPNIWHWNLCCFICF